MLNRNTQARARRKAGDTPASLDRLQPFLGNFATGFLHRGAVVRLAVEGLVAGIVARRALYRLAGRGVEEDRLAVAADHRDDSAPAAEDTAHRGGEVDISVELQLVLGEDR